MPAKLVEQGIFNRILCNTPCIGCAGGVFMCRRDRLRGCVLMGIGIGLLLGQCLDSWFLCSCGGGVLIVVGICGLQKT